MVEHWLKHTATVVGSSTCRLNAMLVTLSLEQAIRSVASLRRAALASIPLG